ARELPSENASTGNAFGDAEMGVHEGPGKEPPAKPPERSAAANAMPTKGFFIKMLVKDIELIPSIIDLVDNSVDGAHRLRRDGSYSGLTVTVDTQKEQFSVVDNCGG